MGDETEGYPLDANSLDMLRLRKQCEAQLSRCAVFTFPANNTSQVSTAPSSTWLTSALAFMPGRSLPEVFSGAFAGCALSIELVAGVCAVAVLSFDALCAAWASPVRQLSLAPSG